ncbi:MAG: hypothetical protein DI629_19535 [Mesorhizobium amorphae]|nr:MAG: hypothetical protein DI629_19535 [Mesorhizobium amorphae]
MLEGGKTPAGGSLARERAASRAAAAAAEAAPSGATPLGTAIDEARARAGGTPARSPARPRRGFRPVLFCTSLGAAVGLAYTLLNPPVFEATAELLVADAANVEAPLRALAASAAETPALRIARRPDAPVITLTARTPDPTLSARTANRAADAFLAAQPAPRPQPMPDLDALREEADRAQRALDEAREAQAAAPPPPDPRIPALQGELDAARSEARALAAQAETLARADPATSLPETLDAPTLAQLHARHAAARAEADRLALTLGPRHPFRQRAAVELDASRAALQAEQARTAQAFQARANAAERRATGLAARLSALPTPPEPRPADPSALEALEREAQARARLYEAARNLPPPEREPPPVTLLARASPPPAPLGATPPVVVGASALLGLLFGLILSFARRAR